VVERCCGSDLQAIGTRKIELLRCSCEIIVEMLPPMATRHQRGGLLTRLVHNPRDYR
jgi:hypothetical protein